MGSRSAAQAQREARVLAAAQTLFATKGYDRTSMREIAELAGVSVGTVAKTGNKASLLGSLFSANDTSAVLGRLAALETRAGTQTSLADDLDGVFEPWFTRLEREPGLVRDFLMRLVGGGLQQAPERSSQDSALTNALTRRVLARHPGIGQETADGLALAIHSVYATVLIGVVIGSLDIDQARRSAHGSVQAMVEGR